MGLSTSMPSGVGYWAPTGPGRRSMAIEDPTNDVASKARARFNLGVLRIPFLSLVTCLSVLSYQLSVISYQKVEKSTVKKSNSSYFSTVRLLTFRLSEN